MPSPHLQLEAPPVGPSCNRHIFSDEDVAQLVPLERMVKGADAKAKLVGNSQHGLHFISAVAVDLDQDVPLQHGGQRFELEVALGRWSRGVGFRLVLVLPVSESIRIVAGVGESLAVSGDVAHPA